MEAGREHTAAAFAFLPSTSMSQMVGRRQAHSEFFLEKDGDISGHLIISRQKKIVIQKEIKHRTSGSFFISSPLWAKGWAFCHSKATCGDSWEPQCVIESQLSLPPEALGDPRALFFREGI